MSQFILILPDVTKILMILIFLQIISFIPTTLPIINLIPIPIPITTITTPLLNLIINPIINLLSMYSDLILTYLTPLILIVIDLPLLFECFTLV